MLGNNWQRQLLRAIGAPVTATNIRFLNEWQLREGGGNKNDANFNPLNTTQKMPGSRSMNGVGVQSYRSSQQGIRALARTLTNGRYNDILSGLRHGASYEELASSPSLKTWGTGTWAGGSGPSASGFGSPIIPLGKLAVPDFTKQDVLQQGLGALASGHYDPMKGLAALQRAAESTAAAAAQNQRRRVSTRQTGAQSLRGASLRPGHGITFTGQHFTHNTDGLPGYPAVDIFAPPGTPFLAPEPGRIIRLSGRGGTSGNVFGWSVYFKGDSGRTYFITHLQQRRGQVGRRYGAGQVLGYVSPWRSGSTHAHVGVHGG